MHVGRARKEGHQHRLRVPPHGQPLLQIMAGIHKIIDPIFRKMPPKNDSLVMAGKHKIIDQILLKMPLSDGKTLLKF